MIDCHQFQDWPKYNSRDFTRNFPCQHNTNTLWPTWKKPNKESKTVLIPSKSIIVTWQQISADSEKTGFFPILKSLTSYWMRFGWYRQSVTYNLYIYISDMPNPKISVILRNCKLQVPAQNNVLQRLPIGSFLFYIYQFFQIFLNKTINKIYSCGENLCNTDSLLSIPKY